MLWDNLRCEESPESLDGAQGATWRTSPLTQWDVNNSLNVNVNGQLPVLEPLLSFEEVQVDVKESKSSDVKCKKTRPLSFCAAMEGSPEGNNEPFHRSLLIQPVLVQQDFSH